MKPIIFSTPMVQAILAGRKTQTRRMIKPQPILCGTKIKDGICFEVNRCGHTESHFCIATLMLPSYCPGDILWVRETWVQISDIKGFRNYAYKTDHDAPLFEKWRPSIHMPREAARIFLRVTDVRVERVQDMSEDDAIAEGVCRLFDHLTKEKYDDWNYRCAAYSGSPLEPTQEEQPYKNYLWHGHFGSYGMGNKQSDKWAYQYSGYGSARDSFSSLWELTNAKRGHGWNTNPWVWAYTFERCSAPDD